MPSILHYDDDGHQFKVSKDLQSVVNGKGSDSNTKGGDEHDGFVIQIDYRWAL